MCRILAKISLSEETLDEELVSAEHSLKKQSENGCVPPRSTKGHADGCGLAYVKDGRVELERRGRDNAWDEGFTKIASTVKCQLAIAHNRKASPGLKANFGAGYAHPFARDFKGVRLAFCHNGGVGALTDKANNENRVDSDIFFEDILDGIQELDFENVWASVSRLARTYREHPKSYTSLTGFLLSPTHLFGWRLYGNPAPKWYPGYYTLSWKRGKERVVIASEPTDGGGGWELLPNGQFLAIGIGDSGINAQERQLDL
jgi:predicted glutamine amidotransferase